MVATALLAIATAAVWFWMAMLASQFVWDDDSHNRPILQVIALLAVQFMLWAIIVRLASRIHEPKQKWVALICCATGLASHLFFMSANPILEHDGYRYLWDASTLNAGVSPYRYSPAEIKRAKEPTETQATKLDLALRARSDWEAASTLDKVGYPEIKTIYPPAAQFAFLTAFKISGWSWTGLRIVFGLAYFCGVLLTFAAQRDRLSRVPIVLLSLCPLAIKEVGNSAHLDAMLVLYFGALLFIFRYHERIRPARLAIASGSVLALAIATKLYPLIAIPILTAWFAARFSWRISAVFVAASIAFVALLYLPFLAMGERSFFSALGPFGNQWLRNESLFGVLHFFSTRAFGETNVSFSGIPGATGPLGTVVAKMIATVLLLVVCGLASRHAFRNARTSDPVEILSRCIGALLIAWFLLLPMAFPWYLLGALPFLACAKWGALPWVLVATVGLFYYGEFYIDANDLPAAWLTNLHRIEYGIPLVFALTLHVVRTFKNRPLEGVR